MDEPDAEDVQLKVLVQQLLLEVSAVLLTSHVCCCIAGSTITRVPAALTLTAGSRAETAACRRPGNVPVAVFPSKLNCCAAPGCLH
jgi:hypothetical protein